MSLVSTKLSRRNLFAAATCASVAATTGQVSCAAEPIAGRKTSHFKLSLAAYSYRGLLTPAKGADQAEMDLHGFIEECAAMQLDGTELTSYYMPESPSNEYLVGLRTHAFRQGLAVSGTAIRNDFGHTDPKRRSAEIDHVKRWVDHAAALHAPMIRIFAGHQKKGVSAEQTHQLMVEGMQECCEYAATQGIYLALENHGGPTASADGLLALVRDVDSPWLGVNLDTGNFREGGDPYQQMAAVASYAVNVQVKVALKGADGKKQPMDFERVGSILKDANYRGFVVLEFEEGGDVPKECRHYVELIRQALAP